MMNELIKTQTYTTQVKKRRKRNTDTASTTAAVLHMDDKSVIGTLQPILKIHVIIMNSCVKAMQTYL